MVLRQPHHSVVGGRVNLNPMELSGIGALSGLGEVSCPSGYTLYAPTNTCTQDPAYRLDKTLNDYLTAASLGQYGDPPPTVDQMASMLSGEAAIICAQSFIPCDASVQQLVQAYVAAYSQWLASYTPGTLFYAPPPPEPVQNTLNNVAPPGPSITPSLVINNASGGSNSQFRVGDTIRVVVTGAPNSPVSLLGTKNNVQFPQTQVGTTDSSGRYIFSAVLASDSIGQWIESWYVGNTLASTITFSVVQASVLQPPNTTPPITDTTVVVNGQAPPPPASGTGQQTTVVGGNWFSDSTTIAGKEIPNLALVGAAGLVLLLVVSSK